MPAASDVRPHKWTELKVLFDDRKYSVVSGFYEGDRALGERWNGGHGGLGFPNQAGHPVWHVVPDFLEVPLLHALLDALAKTAIKEASEYEARILPELRLRLGA